MTFTILKREAGQKIARPLNRASNVDEARELIGNAAAGIEAAAYGLGFSAARKHVQASWGGFADAVDAYAFDTDNAVLTINGVEFFAFQEA